MVCGFHGSIMITSQNKAILVLNINNSHIGRTNVMNRGGECVEMPKYKNIPFKTYVTIWTYL